MGVFAVEAIRSGETVVAFGGYSLMRDELDRLPAARRMHAIQIDEDLFLVGPDPAEPGDFVNHSCDPNLGISGNVVLKAMRDIDAGEELTFDYAMCDSDDYDEFVCECNQPGCRGKITGSDWLLPELQERYRGWYSAYLARRIATLTPIGAERRAFAIG